MKTVPGIVPGILIMISVGMSLGLIGCNEPRTSNTGIVAAAYAQQCGDCHGKLGQGGSAPSHIDCSICSSYETLFDKINKDMPLLKPTTCVDDCAKQMAEYIYEELNGNRVEKGSSP